jgi:hypothetical protein
MHRALLSAVLSLSVLLGSLFAAQGAEYKPRHNFVYTRGDLSRPYQVSVTPQI